MVTLRAKVGCEIRAWQFAIVRKCIHQEAFPWGEAVGLVPTDEGGCYEELPVADEGGCSANEATSFASASAQNDYAELRGHEAGLLHRKSCVADQGGCSDNRVHSL